MLDTFEIYKQLLTGGSTSDMSLFCNGSEDVIIIGGTRQQTFKFPFSCKIIDKVMVVYVQDDHIIIKKTNESNANDFEVSDFDDSLLYFTLKEPETMKFKEGPISVQLKVSLKDGTVNQSPLKKDILISKILHTKGVMPIDKGFFVNGSLPIPALQVNVNVNDIDLVELFRIPAGTNSVYVADFIFDSSWDIYEKSAIFKDEYNNNIEVDIIDNSCVIPDSIIENPGNIYVSIIGTLNDITRVTTWSNSARVITSPLYKAPEDIEQVDQATDTKAGILKLYHDSGESTDGAITQQKITEGFDSVDFVTGDVDQECLILNVDF